MRPLKVWGHDRKVLEGFVRLIERKPTVEPRVLVPEIKVRPVWELENAD